MQVIPFHEDPPRQGTAAVVPGPEPAPLQRPEPETLNLAVYGTGTIGAALLDLIFRQQNALLTGHGLRLRVVAIGNSSRQVLSMDGLGSDWRQRLQECGPAGHVEGLVRFAGNFRGRNLVFVDVTASAELAGRYGELVRAGFHLVAANKQAAAGPQQELDRLQELLVEKQRHFFYETNVGAALPVIAVLRELHATGDRVHHIRGVFSGSLSYLFNGFCQDDTSFSALLQQAVDGHLTEPDPRDDLSGDDVARKLLIVARETGRRPAPPKVENLVPAELRALSTEEFFSRMKDMDEAFDRRRQDAARGDSVLRYVGTMDGSGQLEVSLQTVPKDSVPGRLRGSDAVFEITTERYGEAPLVIQGAGAGRGVTAAGVLGDILRISRGF